MQKLPPMTFIVLGDSGSHQGGVVWLGHTLVWEIFDRYSLVLGEIFKLDSFLISSIATKTVDPDHVFILCQGNLLPQLLWHLISSFLSQSCIPVVSWYFSMNFLILTA